MPEPNCTAADLRPGDVFDAEPIEYFGDDSRRLAVDEYFVVEAVERETDDCIVIYTENGNAAMPLSTPVYRKETQ